MLLSDVLEKSAEGHKHLCPRQVLGVRMGMLAGELFNLALPQSNKRLICFVETDGCFVDGITAATGCAMGHRTMRLMDYGKVATTFVDSKTEKAIRIYPHPESRQKAKIWAANDQDPWHTMLKAYQIMANEDLLCWKAVQLNLSLRVLTSQAGLRVNCEACGEEIINERELILDGVYLCQSCADGAYYTTM
jgi:formylmethanofuran dehydrogenase subunit E